MTIFSPDIDSEKTPNLHYIWADKTYSTIYNGSQGMSIMDWANENSFSAVVTLWDFADVTCKGFLRSDGFKTLMNYPDNFKFDLVLFDYTLGPCLLGFLHKFNYPPLIGLTAFSVPPVTYQFVGGFTRPSYVPHYDVNSGNRMSYLERLENHLVTLWEEL